MKWLQFSFELGSNKRIVIPKAYLGVISDNVNHLEIVCSESLKIVKEMLREILVRSVSKL